MLLEVTECTRLDFGVGPALTATCGIADSNPGHQVSVYMKEAREGQGSGPPSEREQMDTHTCVGVEDVALLGNKLVMV